MAKDTPIVERWLYDQYRKKAPIYGGLMPVIPLPVLIDLISYWHKDKMMSRSVFKGLISYWEKHNMNQFTKSTLATGSFPISLDSPDGMVQFTKVTLLTKSGPKSVVLAYVS